VIHLLLNERQVYAYVIDGRSTDNTIDIAREKGPRIIIEERKGRAPPFEPLFRRSQPVTSSWLTATIRTLVMWSRAWFSAYRHTTSSLDHDSKARLNGGAMMRVNVVGNTPPHAARATALSRGDQRRLGPVMGLPTRRDPAPGACYKGLRT
jgi:hypothetical protein